MKFYQLPDGEIAGFDDPTIAPEGTTEISAEQFAQIGATSVLTLAQAQAAQIAALQGAYQSAISRPVTFKNAAGVSSTYAFGDTVTVAGSNAQALLMQILGAGSAAWTAGVWFDTSGKAQTMTFADLQGLAAAIEAMETPDEQQLMALIEQVQAATTLVAVQAVEWTSLAV